MDVMRGLKLSEEQARKAEEVYENFQYFSFFGSVRKAEASRKITSAFSKRDRAFWKVFRGTYGILVDVRDYLPKPESVEDMGGQDSLTYQAYIYGSITVLVGTCWDGDWQEYGTVVWPLEFNEPAQVAGSCCNPRYGLR